MSEVEETLEAGTPEATYTDLADAAEARGVVIGIEEGQFFIELADGTRVADVDVAVVLAAVEPLPVPPSAPPPDMAPPEALGEVVTGGDDGFVSQNLLDISTPLEPLLDTEADAAGDLIRDDAVADEDGPEFDIDELMRLALADAPDLLETDETEPEDVA